VLASIHQQACAYKR